MCKTVYITAAKKLYRDHNWQVVAAIIEQLLGKDIRKLSLQKLPFTFCREYDGFECAIYDALPAWLATSCIA